MPINPISTWGMGRLDPFMEPEEASEIAVTLVSSGTYPKGTVLGELTANPGLFKAYATGASGPLIASLVLCSKDLRWPER